MVLYAIGLFVDNLKPKHHKEVSLGNHRSQITLTLTETPQPRCRRAVGGRRPRSILGQPGPLARDPPPNAPSGPHDDRPPIMHDAHVCIHGLPAIRAPRPARQRKATTGVRALSIRSHQLLSNRSRKVSRAISLSEQRSN